MANVKNIDPNILTPNRAIGDLHPSRNVEIHVRVLGANEENIRIDIGGRRTSLMRKLLKFFNAIWQGF